MKHRNFQFLSRKKIVEIKIKYSLFDHQENLCFSGKNKFSYREKNPHRFYLE
jgi:hypothetical protein